MRWKPRYRVLTPDELADQGRSRMIAGDIQRAADMRPDLHAEAWGLAEARGDTSLEGMYTALKEVWGG